MDSQRRPRRSSASSEPVRLHKHLARCGLGSRRACEKLIEAGRVSVDGRVVKEQGTLVDPLDQVVKADGKRIEPERKITILLNKPRDVLCTSSDPRGRRTFEDLLPRLPARVFTVGRLDRDSEGLLLVTNDGDLSYRLMHPGCRVEKVYRVWLDRRLAPSEEQLAKTGVRAGNDMLRVDAVDFIEARQDKFVYDVHLHEGRNRHIRRLFGAFGTGVVRLKRIAMGPLKLKGLKSGAWRYVRDGEMTLLRNNIR